MAEESKWEKFKKKDKLRFIDWDEILIVILGLVVFLCFDNKYKIAFILFAIIWYWFKIRYYEKKIIGKEREIYNVYYDNIKPASQQTIDARTEKDREPMRYDLKQLENKRKFLVDKFVIVNLILLILINLFI